MVLKNSFASDFMTSPITGILGAAFDGLSVPNVRHRSATNANAANRLSRTSAFIALSPYLPVFSFLSRFPTDAAVRALRLPSSTPFPREFGFGGRFEPLPLARLARGNLREPHKPSPVRVEDDGDDDDDP